MTNVWNMKLRQSWRPCNHLQNSQAGVYFSTNFGPENGNNGVHSLCATQCKVNSNKYVKHMPSCQFGNSRNEMELIIKLYIFVLFLFHHLCVCVLIDVCSSIRIPELPKSNGFLIIEANGGLNQQRLSVLSQTMHFTPLLLKILKN